MIPLDSVPFERPSGLRGSLRDLFLFSPQGASVGPGGPQLRGIGFGASVVGTNRLLIQFLESAIAGNLSNIPFTSTNASFSVRFEGGVPRVELADPGPIVAERARTLGKDRILVAMNYNATGFRSIRGQDLGNLRFNFAHVNLQGEQCNTAFSGDCDPYGFPSFENDIMQVDLGLDLKVSTLSFVFAYGLLDWLDATVALPVAFASLEGRSRAQILPFEGPPAVNFFDGTADDPELISDPQFVNGSASGVGDVALRVKAQLKNTDSRSLAALVEARFPTGSENDLLGSGEFVARALGIASARFGEFSPHINFGFLHRGGDLLSNAILATAGFDQRLAPWATMAIDIAAQFQIGGSVLDLPPTVELTSPFRREVTPTTIRDQRDDIVDAAFGFKFPLSSGLVFVVNSTWPLNDGGVRANWTLASALEYSF